MATVKETVWSRDGESFQFDSLAELLETYDDLEAGMSVEFGTATYPSTNFVDADDVVELIGTRAYDVGGEYAEDFPSLSDAAVKELSEFLSAWQAKHCKPTFYIVPGAQKYVITEQDIKDATP